MANYGVCSQHTCPLITLRAGLLHWNWLTYGREDGPVDTTGCAGGFLLDKSMLSGLGALGI